MSKESVTSAKRPCAEILALAVSTAAACGQAPQAAGTPDASPDSGAASAVAQQGQVFAFDTKLGGGSELFGLSAQFEQGIGSACASRAVGACSVFRCAPAAGGGQVLSNLNAGTITVTGGSQQAVLVPASDNTYSYSGLVSFSTGATVGFAATGADVAAWNANVTFPSPITVTNPSGNRLVVDHTTDLAMAWTGGSSKVLVTVQEGVPDRLVEVTCLFDGASGTATIPAAALSDLEPSTTLGSGDAQGDVSIYSVAAVELSAGGFPVLVGAGSRAFSVLPTIQ